jgi:hypothetical protein
MVSRDSGGAVGLASWRQGAELRADKIEVPEISSRRIEGTNKCMWEEHESKRSVFQLSQTRYSF